MKNNERARQFKDGFKTDGMRWVERFKDFFEEKKQEKEFKKKEQQKQPQQEAILPTTRW